MRRLPFLLFLLLPGCASCPSMSPYQTRCPDVSIAVDVDPHRAIVGMYDRASGALQIFVNDIESISGHVPVRQSRRLVGHYKEIPLAADCAYRAEMYETHCFVLTQDREIGRLLFRIGESP